MSASCSVGDTVKVLDGKHKGEEGVVRYVDSSNRFALVVTPKLAPFDTRVPFIALSVRGS